MAPQVGLEPTTLRLTGGAEPFSADYCGCIQVPQTTCSCGSQNNMRLLPITATFCQGSPVKSPVLKHAFSGHPRPPLDAAPPARHRVRLRQFFAKKACIWRLLYWVHATQGQAAPAAIG